MPSPFTPRASASALLCYGLAPDGCLTASRSISFERRTASQIEALARGRQHRQRLKELMNNKELLGDIFNQVRLYSQRTPSAAEDPRVNNTLAQLLLLMESFDAMIAPMLMADGENFNRKWGYLSRAGLNDKASGDRGPGAIGHHSACRLDGGNAFGTVPPLYFLTWMDTVACAQSQLARQIEKYADIYTSRVSNFLRYTPFNYFRYATQKALPLCT